MWRECWVDYVFQNTLFPKHQGKDWKRQESWVLNLGGYFAEEQSIHLVLRVSPQGRCHNYKGRRETLQYSGNIRRHLDWEIKINTAKERQRGVLYLQVGCSEKDTASSAWCSSPRVHNLNLIPKRHQTNPKCGMSYFFLKDRGGGCGNYTLDQC